MQTRFGASVVDYTSVWPSGFIPPHLVEEATARPYVEHAETRPGAASATRSVRRAGPGEHKKLLANVVVSHSASR